MRFLRSSLALGTISVFAFALASMTGCTTTVTDVGVDPDTTPEGDGGAGTACEMPGTGAITVNVTGLPADLAAKITLTGPDGAAQAIDATKTLASATAGNYTVSADVVVAPHAVVRTVYRATVSKATFCLGNTKTESVTVSYAAVPSSHKLWTNNGNGDAQLLGFSGDTLATSATVTTSVAAKAATGRDVAFDKDGNLWAFGPTTADAPVARYAASTLGASGEKMPDRQFTIGGATLCSPATSSLAFDGEGNLWIASPCEQSVMRLKASNLGASGEVTPDVKITGLVAPEAIAFDKSGNLWVTDDAKLLRFDASRLGASIADAPNRAVEPQQESTAPLGATALAFDKDGNLWVSDFGSNIVYKITAAELAGTGSQMVVPSVHIAVDVGALLEGLAFDEGGGLWMTYSVGKIAKLGADQLGTSTTPGSPVVPAVIITSEDTDYTDGLAFYPAPASSPLYSRLP